MVPGGKDLGDLPLINEQGDLIGLDDDDRPGIKVRGPGHRELGGDKAAAGIFEFVNTLKDRSLIILHKVSLSLNSRIIRKG